MSALPGASAVENRLANLLVVPFEELRMGDVEAVGGKNASLGEMISQLPTGPKGVQVGHVAINAWIGRQPGAAPDTIAALHWELHTHRDDVEKVFSPPAVTGAGSSS